MKSVDGMLRVGTKGINASGFMSTIGSLPGNRCLFVKDLILTAKATNVVIDPSVNNNIRDFHLRIQAAGKQYLFYCTDLFHGIIDSEYLFVAKFDSLSFNFLDGSGIPRISVCLPTGITLIKNPTIHITPHYANPQEDIAC